MQTCTVHQTNKINSNPSKDNVYRCLWSVYGGLGAVWSIGIAGMGSMLQDCFSTTEVWVGPECVGKSHRLSKIEPKHGISSNLLRLNQTLLRRKKKKKKSLM